MRRLQREREAARLRTPSLHPATLRFPRGFRFGAATAAHQVEGGLSDNSWTRWEEQTRADGRPGIFTGERVGQASDHWNRFDDDLVLMQALGLDTYRFSLAWSRIEPAPGRFDEAALVRYRQWCVALRAAGIEPVVTLHHFTEPGWLSARGGFEHPTAVQAFDRFVRYVVPRLADVVDHWVTVNEPSVYALMGWYRGEFPPGKKEAGLAVRVLEHLLLAHAAAYRAIHELDREDASGDGVPCKAGLAKNVIVFEPQRWWHAADVLLARHLDRFYNGTTLDAITTGRFTVRLPGMAWHSTYHPELAGTADFLGVNHYFRNLVALDPTAPDRLHVGFDEGCSKNDMGWDLTPGSLYGALQRVRDYGLPIYITENGICDAQQPDRRRVDFLLRSLYAVQEAIRDGIDVRGYMHWSLLDNFEWAHGFGPRFGLYRVNYATQERTLTRGGSVYQAAIAAHRKRWGAEQKVAREPVGA